jgi:hypothetical protein
VLPVDSVRKYMVQDPWFSSTVLKPSQNQISKSGISDRELLFGFSNDEKNQAKE